MHLVRDKLFIFASDLVFTLNVIQKRNRIIAAYTLCTATRGSRLFNYSKWTWLSDLMTFKCTKTNHKNPSLCTSWKCNLGCFNSVFICGRLCRKNVLWDLEWLLLCLHQNERSRTDMVSLTLLLQQAEQLMVEIPRWSWKCKWWIYLFN